MRIFARLLEKLYGIAAKYRGALIVVGFGALTLLSLGVSEPALAQCEGPLDAVICPPSGNPYTSGFLGNPYSPPAPPNEPGINVGGNPTDELNVTLESGVNVVIFGPDPGSVNAVNLANTTGPTTGESATLTANNVNIENIASPLTGNNTGLRIQSAGAATITATDTNIDVLGTASDDGILAIIEGNNPANAPKDVTVTWTGQHITSSGANSTGIQADNRGNGNTSIDASGDISGKVGTSGGFTFLGLDAVAGDTTSGVLGGLRDIMGLAAGGVAGNASVIYRSGTINVQGNFTSGIFASADVGSATITTLSGTTIIVSQEFSSDTLQPGVDAFSTSGAATATVASTILINGNPAVPTTNYKSNPTGIRATSDLGGPVSVTYNGPGITVHGGGGLGIVAVSGSENASAASGSATVNAAGSGPIVADGSNAIGILADSGTIRNQTSSGGRPTTTITGPVQVTASNVSTPGEFGAAISATGGSGGVTVNIPSGGLIMGGWQPDVTSVGVTYGLPSAGVILGSSVGAATLTNGGSIGALSDRAIAGDPQVINNGTITGFTQFVGGNNSIVNNGTFNLRDFEDTTGAVGGVRDTVRVAIADLGTGANNSFTNNGTLALASVTGATTLDRTGEYLPLGNANNAMALGGPLQGQMIGVTTFTNSGTIDLQANPVPGDVFVITGARTAGVAGPGTYISNGGSLMLDTVLNEGGAATLSDTLVVDGTSVGAGGATKTSIRNAGGAGAETVGDGILVVQVLDPARSAAGAFSLAEPELRAGAFDYDLFHGGVGGSNPADWFLRSTFMAPELPGEVVPPETSPPTTPLPPVTSLPTDPPPNPLPPGVAFPIIGPELATYGVVQPLARQLGLSILGTLDDRVGDTYEPDGCAVAPAAASAAAETSAVDLPTKKPAAVPTKKPGPAPCPLFSPSVWGRFFGQTIHNNYQAFAAPSASGDLGGFQGGIDLLRGSLIAGQYERAGLYGAYGDVHADVNGLVTNPAATAYVLTHTGSMNLDAWSAGGYWTHVGPGGWYLDAVLQGTWYYGSASTQFARLNTDGTGFIASLEGGYPYAWPQLGPGFVIEPQGQILWQKVSFRHDYDGLGDVALGDTTGPSGRIGLRTKWTIVTGGGQVWQPYLRANLWRDWGADANTVYSGTDIVPLASQVTRLELGGGLTGRINANVSVFANVDYEFAVGAAENEKQSGVRGAFGARYTW